MDIVGSGYLNSRVAWYANNGENPPSFSRQLISTSSINACVSKTADFDGNGFLDVATSEQGKNTVAVFFNDGATPFNWTRQDLSNNFVRPWPLDIADLDGDGDPDIVSASSYDGSNKVHWWRNERSLSVPDASILPDRSVLLANYPNPFNSSTRIFYQLPDAAAVEIGIYNMLGQQIRSYPMGTQVAGGHEVHWDGMTKAQVEAVSGVYTVVLRVDDLVESQRIVLIR